jgi:hypothetical protein
VDVTGVGASPNPPAVDLPGLARGTPAPKPADLPNADTVATLLGEVAGADLARLLEMVERPLTPQAAAQVEALFREAVSASAAGDAGKALGQLAALAPLDPRRAETLTSDPALAPLRGAVESLMARLTSAARLDAESRLEQARSVLQLLESARPEAAVLMAARLLEAGGYANAVRSSELSQMAIDQCRWAPAPVPLPAPEIQTGIAAPPVEGKPLSAWKRLWQRDPLAVILPGWGAVGLIGGGLIALFRDDWPASAVALCVEFWVIGLLAVVVFAFYTRVRGRRF